MVLGNNVYHMMDGTGLVYVYMYIPWHLFLPFGFGVECFADCPEPLLSCPVKLEPLCTDEATLKPVV